MDLSYPNIPKITLLVLIRTWSEFPNWLLIWQHLKTESQAPIDGGSQRTVGGRITSSCCSLICDRDPISGCWDPTPKCRSTPPTTDRWSNDGASTFCSSFEQFLGLSLDNIWVLLKEPFGCPWRAGRFEPKYSHIQVRILTYHFIPQTTHKTYKGTLVRLKSNFWTSCLFLDLWPPNNFKSTILALKKIH